MFNRKKDFIVLFLFFNAVLLMGYPYVANFIFEHQTESLVTSVEKVEEQVDDTEKEEIRKIVKRYNEEIFNGGVKLCDPFKEEIKNIRTVDYNKLLNINQEGVMGIVSIPTIGIKLPIYHGTSEKILEKGIGHLEGSSLPVGGENTHTVLTGHTGLSNAKLFTDLTELEKGELFFLNILGEQLVYQVDQIKKVLPTDLEELCIKEGEDYCTLVTCTPYGVNTHRLLVRGKRIQQGEKLFYYQDIKKKHVESKWMEEYEKALKYSLIILGICLFVLFVWRKNREKGKSCM